ncbi:hypothetical protein L7F22_042965 [Adiantum nelumboides]|nr:hypothetical protein [Adiantum nelumboides]
MHMAQLMENAEVADDLIQGKPDEDGFKTRRKEPQERQFSAKGNFTSRLTVPPFKKKPFAGSKPFAGNRPFNSGNRPNAENQQFRPPFSGQRPGFKRHFTGKTTEERKALRDAKKCYICEEGHSANECPQRNSQNKDDKSDRKGKKPKPSAGLVPDMYAHAVYCEYRYHTDPSGTFWQCNGKAIGSGSEGADTSLQEHYSKDMTLEEAETLALSTLKQVMEEKVTPNNVDIAKVAPTYHLYSPKEVEAVIARL